MKKSTKIFVIALLVNIVFFYLVPYIIVDTGSAMTVMLIVLPLSCLITALIYGALNSFQLIYPLSIALVFIPTIWLHYNESAWVYIFAYGIIALIGNLLGACYYKYKHKMSDNIEH